MIVSRKDIQLDLLNKFNELCSKANVKYVLHGQGALLAYTGDEIDNIESLEVMMCQGDAEKIVDLLDDDAYYFEDFRSNPKFDNHFMMFGYKNSLDLKMRDINFMTTRHIENHCIRLNIRFIEHPVPKGKGKKLKIYRKIWKLKNMDVHSNNLWKYKYGKKALVIFSKVIGEKRLDNHRYNIKKKNYSIDTWNNIKKYPLVRISGTKAKDSKLFNEIAATKLGDVSTYIIKDFENYATAYYGVNWRMKKWKSSPDCSSTIISWEVYSRSPEYQKCCEKIQERYENNYYRTLDIEKSRDITNNLKNHVRQSGRIVHTRDDFIEQKEKIQELYKNNDLDELEVILKPLIQAMQHGIRLGYTYSVDEDIDNILDSYLRKVDREELANQIKSLRINV
ncbi:hypothetical protein [Methanobrevibacter sp.]|uniref:hypothetical protein n=1 Tax=Methanobrevibacter sp. TaxID=66852 RepID=UPI0038682A4B